MGYHIIGIGRGSVDDFFLKKWGINEWIEGEVNLQIMLSLNKKIDLIIHCGGGSSVSYSNDNPIKDFNNSVISTINVLEYIKRSNLNCKLIYPSSPAVLGNINEKIKPTLNYNPISPYGFNKKVAEEMCLFYNKKYNISIGIIRFFFYLRK